MREEEESCTNRLMATVRGKLTSVRAIVKSVILIPLAEGIWYVPFGVTVLDPPMKAIDTTEIITYKEDPFRSACTLHKVHQRKLTERLKYGIRPNHTMNTKA